MKVPKWFDSPDKRGAVLAVAEVLLILADVPEVILAAHQKNWRVGAESPDLRIPHDTAVSERDWVGHREAKQHHIRPAAATRSVLWA